MATEQVIVQYRADIRELLADLDRLITANENLKKSVDGTGKEFRDLPKEAESGTRKQIGLINQLEKELKELKKARKDALPGPELDAYNNKIKSLTASLKRAKGEAVQFGKISKKEIGGASKFISSAIGKVSGALAAAFSIQQLIQYANQVTRLQAEFDALRISINFIEEGVREGGETFQFLTDLAEEYGLELQSTIKAYRQFSGAARLAGFSAAETKKVFESVSTAVTAMGLSAQQADRVFLALSQIISKGVVSAEELRRQLGDALPGAFSIAAKSVGVTEAELNKLLQTGQLISKDFLPAFADELRNTFQEGAVEGAKSLNAELNRLQNQITEFNLGVGEEFARFWVRIKSLALEFVNAVFPAIQFYVSEILPKLNIIAAAIKIAYESSLTEAEKAARESERIEKENIERRANIAKDLTKRVEDEAKKRNEADTKAIKDNIKLLREQVAEGLISETEYYKKIDEAQANLAQGERRRLEARQEVIDEQARNLGESLNAITQAQKEANDAAQALALGDKAFEIQVQLDALDTLTKENQELLDGLDKSSDKVEAFTRRLLDVNQLRLDTEDELLRKQEEELKGLDDINKKNQKIAQENLKNIEKEFEERQKVFDSLFEQYEKEREAREKLFSDTFIQRVKIVQETEGTGPALVAGEIEIFEDLKKQKDEIDILTSTYEDSAQAQIVNAALKLKAEEEAQERIKKLYEELGFVYRDNTKELAKAAAQEQRIRDEILRGFGDLFEELTNISAAFTDRRLQDLDIENEKFKENIAEQRAQLEDDRENRLITEKQYQDELETLNQREIDNQEAVNRKKNELAKKQAIIDKASALFQIALATREAINKANALSAEPITKALLIALAASIGAAQAAAVIATPVPKFAKGTKGKKGSGMALVGEQGPEQVFLPDQAKVMPTRQTRVHAEAFDAMYDNRFDDYVLRDYVLPALQEQKRKYEESKSERFAENVASSMKSSNSSLYWDLENIRKKGQKVVNSDDIGMAVARHLNKSTRSRRRVW